MRNPDFCICENKDADQLRGDRGIRIVQSLYYRNFKPQAIFCGCTAWFVSDLVGNPEDRFSHNEAHMIQRFCIEKPLFSTVFFLLPGLIQFKFNKGGPRGRVDKVAEFQSSSIISPL